MTSQLSLRGPQARGNPCPSARYDSKGPQCEVRYYHLRSGDHNIGEDGPLAGLNRMLVQKGFVMNINESVAEVKPIQEVVQSDPVIRSIVDEVAKGNINATAPHEHMNKVWTEEEKQRLFAAMEFFYPKHN